MNILQEEELAGHHLTLRWREGEEDIWLAYFYFGKHILCTLNVLYLPRNFMGVDWNLLCSCQKGAIRILPVSVLIGLSYPGGFLIVSHRWEYQPTPLSLRALRPSMGKGCDPGSDSNWVYLNPGFRYPHSCFFPTGLSGLLHSGLLKMRPRGPGLTQEYGLSLFR